MPDPTPTVLIIDNDEGIVRAIQIRLESLGYRCATACSGAQGISCYRGGGIDLVITDLNMPAGDGVTVVSALREIGPVPIIVVTGFREEYTRRLRDFDDVTTVEKPFNSNHLVDLVEAELMMAGRPLPA